MPALPIVSVILLAASTVAAQPHDSDEPPRPPAPPVPAPRIDRAFLGTGLMLGLDHFIDGAMLLEGGVRLGTWPVWAHAIGAAGGAMDFEGTGEFRRAVAGIEVRPGAGAGFIDLDAGYQSQTWSDGDVMDDEHHHGPLLQARFGVDVGGENLRVRAALELGEYHRHSDVEPTAWTRSFGAVLVLAYRM
jgi:hypothetical protein